MNQDKLTLIFPYYDNPVMLGIHFAEWTDKYSADIKKHVEVVIVDDCSAKAPALPVVKQWADKVGFPVRLFYIKKKVMWNWQSARNIGAYEAADSWLFLSDMDMDLAAPDAEQVIRLMKGRLLKEDAFYLFDRVKAPNGEGYKSHPNTYLMSRDLYWHVGGYDEEFAGIYGCDGSYRRLILRVASGGHFHLHGINVTYYPRSYVPDSGVQDDGRKETRDAIKNKVALHKGAKKLQNGVRPTALTFPYERQV
jgi:hypothetical protein